MPTSRTPYRWFVPGDINGFFGLFFDNLTVLSILSGILIFGFQFPKEVVFTRMFPGTALGVMFGDIVYTWMALRLAKRTGNPNVTAMPLGLDTPSTIGIALVVLGPAFLELKSLGLTPEDAAMKTWYIGMATMIYMGLLKLVCSFLGNWVQRIVPKAALLGSIAGIGLALIGVQPLVDIFGLPLVGVIALGIVFYSLIAGFKLPFKIPGVLGAILVGTGLYYLLAPHGIVGGTYAPPPPWTHDFALPLPTFDFIQGLKPALKFLPVAIPFGLLTVIGGINVNESARASGDEYNTRSILLTEALATLLAGMCGGVAQTTPYIGQPAYKNMGAHAGYTLLTGILIGLGAMFGQVSFLVQLIPSAVLAPILVFVALDITIQAFHAVPQKHAPAVAFSFFPTLFRLLSIKLGNPDIVPSDVFNKLMTAPGKSLPDMQVIIALGNGFILTAMLWGAFLAELIDKHLRRASTYLLLLAILTFFGITHSALADGSMYFPWALDLLPRQVPYQFATAYAALALLFLLLSFQKHGRH